jgi:putative hydrolase of the HAD superfamily
VRALLFDMGDVLTKPAFCNLDRLEEITGRRIEGRGPYANGADERWEQVQRGELGKDDYWNGVARSAGVDDWRRLYSLIANHLPDEMLDPDMLGLADDAKAAGHRIGILTNDMVAISGPTWVQENPHMARFDAIVDATLLGVRKPDPRAYEAACEALAVDPGDVVFLDDTEACILGAVACGMTGIWVDTFDRAPAITATRRALDLP